MERSFCIPELLDGPEFQGIAAQCGQPSAVRRKRNVVNEILVLHDCRKMFVCVDVPDSDTLILICRSQQFAVREKNK